MAVLKLAGVGLRRSTLTDAACVAVLLCLYACGGGGGGGGSSPTTGGTPGGSGDGWMMGVYQPSSHFAAQCQNPRSGNDPSTGKPYPDVQGTTLDENNWLRSWTNELYLWYEEVSDVDPGTYATTAAYFAILKTSATTSTAHPKDRFHFTYPTSQWEQLSQAGVDIGYGLTWDIAVASPPRQVYAAFVWPGYAAAAANVVRGSQVLAIDGVDMVNSTDTASLNTLNEGLSPTSAGESHTFTLQAPGSNTSAMVTMQAQNVTETPVPVVTTIATGTGPVGYILFNDHIATSEGELINAINQLRAANVTDLVLDIRYNGGGYLDIASELAYMIAGPGPTTNEAFDQQTFNTKYTSTNPVTGQPLTPTPFHSTSQGFSSSPPAGTALPYLGLSRVFVLTGPGTCSASEAVINGLNGVNVQVIQIGSITCGKPYGFYPQDNCGTTYFSIEFQGNNAKGFGDYPDGFAPQNSPTLTSAVLPGCSVADDFTHALGDPAEGRYAAALGYRAGQACPSPPTGITPHVFAVDHAMVHKAPWRENRIMRQ
ncbi:MAG: peptidase [Gammaproteobacteria bacterium]|nr:peptidase [Gammaproteobacteria bacterium]